MRRCAFLLVFVWLCAICSPASASLVLSFGSATATSGSATTIDVFLDSAPGDELFRFNYSLSISSPVAGSGTLNFVNGTQSDSERTLADYIFVAGGQAFTQTGSGLTLTGSAQAFAQIGPDTFTVFPIPSGRRRIATLDVVHTGPMSVAFHDFTISATSFVAFPDAGNTPVAVNFTNTGTLRFTNTVSAVPEPSTILGVGIFLPVACIVRSRRRQSVSE